MVRSRSNGDGDDSPGERSGSRPVEAQLGRGTRSLGFGSGADRPWWADLVTAAMRSPVVDRRRSIYTNRTLRFDRVKAVGFDFDHTLAVYNCENLDSLAMELVIERLVKHESFSQSFFDHIPDPSFARKGLLVDTQLGLVTKVDRYGHITQAYRGDQRIGSREKRELYGEQDVIPNVTDGDRFVQIDSAFAKPEVLIFASVAPHLDAKGRGDLWSKIRKHTDQVHKDGTLKEVITARPLDFLRPDLDTIALLQHLREGGKKVFLVTNSEWEYTRAMMNPALGVGIDETDLTWQELFDLVVVFAKKPKYFSPKRGAGPVTLGPDHVMLGGHISDLEERIGCSGPEILYVGDHIYADLISSKRRQHWRTLMVISELDEELHEQSGLPGIVEQLKQTDDRRVESEREVDYWTSIQRALKKFDDPAHASLLEELEEECGSNREKSQRALREFIGQREGLRNKLSLATNQYWGSLFRASSELTYYGRQLEDFACLYTSFATNLLFYGHDHYFRSAMDYLPHELEQL